MQIQCTMIAGLKDSHCEKLSPGGEPRWKRGKVMTSREVRGKADDGEDALRISTHPLDAGSSKKRICEYRSLAARGRRRREHAAFHPGLEPGALSGPRRRHCHPGRNGGRLEPAAAIAIRQS